MVGFSVIWISIEGCSRAPCKIIFFDNRVLYLSSVLPLVLILFIYKIYLVLFMLYCLGTQVCADHVSNVFIRFGRFDLRLPVFRLCCCSWSFFCRLGNLSFSKIPNNLTQYRGTMEIFNSRHFVHELKHKNLPLLSHSHKSFPDYISFSCFFILTIFHCVPGIKSW